MQQAILGPDGSPVRFVEAHNSYLEDCDGLIVKQEQEIPGWFLDDLTDERQQSTNTRAGEFHRVARVPEVIVLELKNRYNFDVLREPVQETVKMLKRLHLDLFVATRKSI